MKKISLVTVVAAFLFQAYPVSGQNLFEKGASSLKGWFSGLKKNNVVEEHPDIFEFTIDQNLVVPETGQYSDQIRSAQDREIKRLQKIKNITLATLRGGEVIRITIPMSQLFLPNDTVLNAKSDLVLRPYLPYMRVPDYYHILLVAHSDDTGSESYLMQLSSARANAVFDWFKNNGGNVDYLVPYGVGGYDPLKKNDSMDNRADNRRLEIYLIPAEEMILQAKKGLL